MVPQVTRPSKGGRLPACQLWICSVILFVGCTPTVSAPQITLPVDEQVAEKPKPDPNAVEPITYEDLDLPMEPDSVFQDWMLTQRVRDLDGRRVRISGYMFAGSLFTTGSVKQFFMLREQECPFGPGGQAHHAIEVELVFRHGLGLGLS